MAGTLMLSVSGCRGIVGETLTPEVISRFAGTFGGWLREHARGASPTVVVGRDGRAGGDMVRLAAMAGLTGAGCSVVDQESRSLISLKPALANSWAAQWTAWYALEESDEVL